MIHIYYKLGLKGSDWIKLSEDGQLDNLVDTLRFLAVFATSDEMAGVNIFFKTQYKVVENGETKFILSFKDKEAFTKTTDDLKRLVKELEKEEK